MPKKVIASAQPFDTTKFVHPAQVGGIEAYSFDNGAARGGRALLVNTGGGLRYRLLVDRGLDIDQAFFNQHSLAFLTHKGVTPPAQGLERGIDWLKTFPGGLLTSCGPFNIGAPSTDAGEDLPLHGPHSNTPAEIESVVQPDPHAGRNEMSVVGVFRYGRLFGPNLTLRRTIRSTLGQNAIHFTDVFYNAGNQPVPHAWLLHINLGYPLVDGGAEFCYDAKVVPLGNPVAQARFKPGGDYKKVPNPLEAHRGSTEAVAYLYPKASRDGSTTVGLVNRKVGVGIAIDYNTKQFGRCVNWQHWGPGEYVTALEPSNGSVEGRAKDRAEGVMDMLEVGESKTYEYSLRILGDRAGIDELRALNG
ncbi:DUF4432 family protein [Humisphaera borealis]|uniref:DUF4432 family protein n=1 Tax=Humisphaera borealis TaxID=2807512 RepID=A0A7M2WUN3_9BACT|nr:DUF4432 family protein [Humisphaera borealis]QOV89103.1 DUF4432 family protein [Humisphaera borealis]